MFPFYILVNVGSLSWNVTAIFSPDSICIRYDKNIDYQWISMISTELEILSVFYVQKQQLTNKLTIHIFILCLQIAYHICSWDNFTKYDKTRDIEVYSFWSSALLILADLMCIQCIEAWNSQMTVLQINRTIPYWWRRKLTENCCEGHIKDWMWQFIKKIEWKKKFNSKIERKMEIESAISASEVKLQ